jgi:hypothetical protein
MRPVEALALLKRGWAEQNEADRRLDVGVAEWVQAAAQELVDGRAPAPELGSVSRWIAARADELQGGLGPPIEAEIHVDLGHDPAHAVRLALQIAAATAGDAGALQLDLGPRCPRVLDAIVDETGLPFRAAAAPPGTDPR